MVGGEAKVSRREGKAGEKVFGTNKMRWSAADKDGRNQCPTKARSGGWRHLRWNEVGNWLEFWKEKG